MKKIITSVLAGAIAVGSVLGAYTANYTPADMPSIATDIIGEGGVQLKVYMPLLVLGFVATGILGTFAVIRARLR